MRVFLTGGAGFIGSHLAEALLARGDHVFSVDNFDAFYPRLYKSANLRRLDRAVGFHFTEADFRDGVALRRLMETARPEVVLHLGGKAGVRPSVQDPLGYVSVNVVGTAEVLAACRDLGIRKLLLASSSSVYGDDSPVPFREDFAANRPASPYAATKKAAEEVAHAFHHVCGIDVVCLRYFTVYGPRQRPEMAVHKFARYLTASRPLPLYGAGRLQRDYTFVSDIVAGSLAALDFLRATPGCFEVFNLGNSRAVPLHELVELLQDELGIRGEIQYEAQPPGDVTRTWADVSKARAVLGYDPAVPLEEGIRLFGAWFREEGAELAASVEGAPTETAHR